MTLLLFILRRDRCQVNDVSSSIHTYIYLSSKKLGFFSSRSQHRRKEGHLTKAKQQLTAASDSLTATKSNLTTKSDDFAAQEINFASKWTCAYMSGHSCWLGSSNKIVTMSILVEFPLFPRLSLEVRMIIWRFALPRGGLVRFGKGRSHPA